MDTTMHCTGAHFGKHLTKILKNYSTVRIKVCILAAFGNKFYLLVESLVAYMAE